MSSSNGSTVKPSKQGSWGYCGGGMGRHAKWTSLNIAAMVLGFVFAWPLGLFMVYWIVTGRDVSEIPPAARQLWARATGGWTSDSAGSTDNVVFNDYQQTQYDRIREIKEEMRGRAERFKEFRMGAKRRADQDEFNRFMADKPAVDDQ